MDRRSFLATGATVALLPLAEAPALAAPPPRAAATPSSTAVRGHLPGAGAHFARARHLARPRQGPQRRRSSRSSRRGPAPVAAARGPGAQPPRHRRGSKAIGPATPVRRRQAQPRGRDLLARRPRPMPRRAGTSTAPSGPIRSSSRAAPISTLPTSSTPRTRSTMPSDAEAYLSRLQPVRDHARQRHRRAARAGRARLPRAGLVDRPGARPDAQAARRRAGRQHDGRIDRQAHRREGHRAATGAARATEIVAAAVYPALDRQIAAMETLRPTSRPGDGAWRLPNGDAIYAEALRQATTTNFTPAEVHQMGLAQVAEIIAPDRHDPQEPGLYPGHRRRAPGRAQQGSRRSSTPTRDAGRAELLASLNAGVKDMYGRLPQAFATVPSAAARDPPRAAGNPGRRVQRLLPPRLARWLAPGDLLHQPQGHRRLAEIFAADAHLSRGRPRPSSADQHRAGIEGHSDAAQARLLLGLFRRLGALRRAARRRARRLSQRPARPRRLPPVVPVPRRAAGGRHRPPHQALEPRAGDRLHGRDHRLRARRARSARSSATARRSARRAATRSATSPGSARATDAQADARRPSSTSSSSTRCCKEGAMPLSILERRIRERTAALAGGRASRTERG